MATFFCDGLKEVTILNGVARLEFHRLQPSGPERQNRDVQPVTELVMAMPAQGFLQALSVLEQVRDQLLREGVLKPGDAPPAAPDTPTQTPTRSPNFS